MKEMVEGFVVEGFPFVFESKELVIRAMFPAKKEILRYEEREEVSKLLGDNEDREWMYLHNIK